MCLKRIHLGEKAQTYVGCIDLHTRGQQHDSGLEKKIFISKSEKKKEIENYSSRMKAPTKKKEMNSKK